MRNGTQPGARTSASPMSALGQKQTFAVQSAMSALHLRADMCSAQPVVRFVPIADIALLRGNSPKPFPETGAVGRPIQTLPKSNKVPSTRDCIC